MRTISRKSFFYKKNYKKGERISLDNLKLLRPGNGLSFKDLNVFIKNKLKKNVGQNNMVKKSDFR
jgi:sialic acid synthase SpsE